MLNKNELITELQKEIILLSDNTFYYAEMCSQLQYLIYNISVDQYGIINDLENDKLIDLLAIIYDDKDELISKVKLVTKILDLVAIDKRLLLLQDIDEVKVKDIFKEILMLANKKKDEYELIISKNKRTAKNRKNFYEAIINYLKQSDDKYISIEEIFNSFKFIPEEEKDNEYLFNFLKIITLQNKKIYDTTIEENKRFSNCTQKEIEMLFASPINSLKISNLSKNDKDKLFRYGNIDKINELLAIRRKYNLTFFDTKTPYFVDVLLYASNKTFERVCMILMDNGIETITDPYIFIDKENEFNNNSLYEIFIFNVNLLRQYKIDISKLSKYDSKVLVSSPTTLLSQLCLLSKYNIDFSKIFNKKYNCNYELLYNSGVFDIADLYIESDEEEYIKKHPFVLRNEMKDISKRAYISKRLLSMSIYEDTDKKQILPEIFTGNNFIAANEELDEILLNQSSYNIDDNMYKVLDSSKRDYILNDIELIDLIKLIDKRFKISPLQYNFDGIIISRNRFLRNISVLIDRYGISMIDKFIMPSLIYNSYLSNEEIDFISDKLDDIYGYAKVR
jgi:hypothetical protein